VKISSDIHFCSLIFRCALPYLTVMLILVVLQVETFGAMAKTEKIAFILEQVC